MRFHVIGMPHTISNSDFNACAYTSKLLRFCKMMLKRSHHVIHYGNVGSEVECSENVDVMTKEMFEKEYGTFEDRSKFYECKYPSPYVHTYNLCIASEIRQRAKDFDFVICLYGNANKAIADNLQDMNVFVVEASVGYQNTFSEYRIFESYAKQEFQKGIWHANYEIWNDANSDEEGNLNQGIQRPVNCVPCTEPQWTDDVIGAFLDPSEFEYCDKKDDYFLYLGRIKWNKGVEMSVKVSEELNQRMIIAGQGDYNQIIGKPPKNVELVGHADIDLRKKLMSKAKASFLLTQYNEVFGHVVIENALSGTPIITTDWGSFSDIVRHGETGYRVRNYDEAVRAAKQIDKIKPETCREWGINFTMDFIAPQYEEYFERLLSWSQSEEFYSHDPYKTSLDFRKRENPSIEI